MLVIAPCGFITTGTIAEKSLFTKRKGWHQLAAVQAGKVFIVDYDLFTQPAAFTLTDGISLLAALLPAGV